MIHALIRRRIRSSTVRAALYAGVYSIGFTVLAEAASYVLAMVLSHAYGVSATAVRELLVSHLPAVRALEFKVLLVFCGGYGAVRAAGHPANLPAYRRWLQSTPWTWRKPLPLEAVEFRIPDAVLLAAWTGFTAWWLAADVLAPAVAMLGGYVLVSLTWLGKTKRGETWLIVWGLGAAVVAGWDTRLLLPLAAGLYVVCWRALRAGLADFPWGLDEPKSRQLPPIFPWQHLKPLHEETPQARASKHRCYLLLSLTFGWLVYCIATRREEMTIDAPQKNPREIAMVLSAAVGMWFAFVRWAVYRANRSPPILLRTRIWTGRLIIPRYDVMLLAPLAVGVASLALPAALWLAKVPAPALMGVTGGALLALTLCLGPSQRVWQLTGQYQVVPSRRPTRTSSKSESH
jgi:hypothetical protein